MKRSTLTLAITLAFSFTAAPADALLTEGQKCAMKANLLSGKFSLCLSKADANVSKGRLSDTAAADAKCETKFRDGWDKTRTKAQEKDADNGNAEMLGADCNGAMSDAVRDSVEASALIAAGRHDMRAFAVSEADLADDSGVQGLIDEAVAAVDITSDNAALCTDAGGTYYAGSDTTSPVCSVDITSDNAAAEQAGCEAANGTWAGSVCTPAAPAAAPYNCFIGGFCSQVAIDLPPATNNYTNVYDGHTQTTEPALGAGCGVGGGPDAWELGIHALMSISCIGEPGCPPEVLTGTHNPCGSN